MTKFERKISSLIASWFVLQFCVCRAWRSRRFNYGQYDGSFEALGAGSRRLEAAEVGVCSGRGSG